MKNRRIVLITPESREAESLAVAVHSYGYTWRHIQHASELAETVADFPPDLVIVNALLPIADVREITTYLREHTSAKILMTSAINRATLAFSAKHRWEIDEFVTYPVPIKKLGTLIAYMLGDEATRPYLRNLGDMVVHEKSTREMRRSSHRIPGRGDLAEISVGRLMNTVIRHGLSGSLIIADTDRRMELLLAEGRLMELRSPYMPNRGLGDILAHGRKIPAAQVAPMVDEARRQGVRLGELLRAQRVIDEDDLRHALDEQVVAKLADIFDWSDGHYRLRPETAVHPIEEPRNLSLAKVAFLAARRAAAENDFAARYAAYLEGSVRLNPAAAIRPNMLELTNDEKRFLFTLDGRRPLRDLVARPGDLRRENVQTLLAAAIDLRIVLCEKRPRAGSA